MDAMIAAAWRSSFSLSPPDEPNMDLLKYLQAIAINRIETKSLTLVYIVQPSNSTSSSSHKSNAYRSGRRGDCGSPADEATAALRPTRRRCRRCTEGPSPARFPRGSNAGANTRRRGKCVRARENTLAPGKSPPTNRLPRLPLRLRLPLECIIFACRNPRTQRRHSYKWILKYAFHCWRKPAASR